MRIIYVFARVVSTRNILKRWWRRRRQRSIIRLLCVIIRAETVVVRVHNNNNTIVQYGLAAANMRIGGHCLFNLTHLRYIAVRARHNNTHNTRVSYVYTSLNTAVDTFFIELIFFDHTHGDGHYCTRA